MAEAGSEGQGCGVPEALRAAIESTFAATAGSAAETRDRAGELLDQVARRGQDAREVMARRGQEAGEASAGAASKVIEAIERMRVATREDLRELEGRLEQLARRIEELERLEARVASIESQPPVER